ncbi:MAG TPA: hypothetical protein DCS82_02400 [Rhodospirillaceae bacterium]|nr:hypothetical protein [Rhodospirillaceae bacterium]
MPTRTKDLGTDNPTPGAPAPSDHFFWFDFEFKSPLPLPSFCHTRYIGHVDKYTDIHGRRSTWPPGHDKFNQLDSDAYIIMARITKLILILLFMIVLGGGFFLATWEFPPPSKPVEKVIDDKRFSK